MSRQLVLWKMLDQRALDKFLRISTARWFAIATDLLRREFRLERSQLRDMYTAPVRIGVSTDRRVWAAESMTRTSRVHAEKRSQSRKRIVIYNRGNDAAESKSQMAAQVSVNPRLMTGLHGGCAQETLVIVKWSRVPEPPSTPSNPSREPDRGAKIILKLLLMKMIFLSCENQHQKAINTSAVLRLYVTFYLRFFGRSKAEISVLFSL